MQQLGIQCAFRSALIGWRKPIPGVEDDMYTAKEKLLVLYLKTVNGSEYLTVDNNLLKFFGCFE